MIELELESDLIEFELESEFVTSIVKNLYKSGQVNETGNLGFVSDRHPRAPSVVYIVFMFLAPRSD